MDQGSNVVLSPLPSDSFQSSSSPREASFLGWTVSRLRKRLDSGKGSQASIRTLIERLCARCRLGCSSSVLRTLSRLPEWEPAVTAQSPVNSD